MKGANGKGGASAKGAGSGKGKARPKGRPSTPPRPFWGPPSTADRDDALAAARPPSIRPSPDPAAVVRSLGSPPLPGHETAAEHYFGAVYERAVGLAGALAAAGGLLDETDGDDSDDSDDVADHEWADHAEADHPEADHAETGHAEAGHPETGHAEADHPETGHAETARDDEPTANG
jgi:hypothetical protein